MKSVFVGIVAAAALPMLTIGLSDFFLFDIPEWATWPLVGLPLIAGVAVGLINFLQGRQHHKQAVLS